MTIINFQQERLKRMGSEEMCLYVLESFFGSLVESDPSSRELLMREFLDTLTLGPRPISQIAFSYFRNDKVAALVDAVVERLPDHMLANLIEFAEKRWPEDKETLKKLKVILIGLTDGTIPSEDYIKASSLVERYLTQNDAALEMLVMHPKPTVIPFPSHPPKSYKCLSL